MPITDRLTFRTILTSSALTLLAIAVLGTATAFAICVPSSYTVTSSAPPPIGNWTDTTGAVWSPTGGFPGCAPGDTATDTNGSPTTLIINSAIPNPIIGLNLACNGCIIDIQSGGSLTLAGSGSIGSGATLRVSGGTLTIASAGALTFQSGSQFELDNGLVDVQSNGSLTPAGTNTTGSGALLRVSGGTLTIPSGVTLPFQSGSQFELDSGTVDNQSGGTVDFQTGSTGASTGGVFSGNGTLSISGGTLNIGSVTSPGTFVMSAGTLTGPGFLSIGQQFNWDGGTLTGGGGAELAGAGQGTISGAIGATVLDGRTFNNYGYIHYTATTNPLQLNNGATFSTFGTFEIDDDGPINGVSPASFNVYPNGLLWKVGGSGTTTIYPQVTNNATVFGSNGTLEFAGNSTNSGGFLAFSPGTIKFSASSSVFDANSGIGGDGTIKFSAGTSEIHGDYDVEGFSGGMTDICGGTVDVESSGFTNDFKFTSGTLTVNGDFTMGETGTWSGGTMNASNPNAYFDVASGATLTIDAATGSPTDDFLIFANDGTVNYTADATSGNFLTFANDAIADNTGLFDIQTDAQIASTNGVIIGDSKTASASAAGRGRAAKTGGNEAATEARARRLASASVSAAKRGKPHVLSGCGCPVSNELDNSGTVKKSAGSGAAGTDFGPDFVNGNGSYTGLLKALSGKINFLGTFEQDGSSSVTTLGGGDISAANGFELNAGTLEGGGTITGNLDNYGNVTPGTSSTTGVINVTGNYVGGSAGSGGTLTIKLAGPPPNPGQFDQLNVTGDVTLDGTFTVNFLPSTYAPAGPITWPVFTFGGTRTGDFTTKNDHPADPNGTVTSIYQSNELDVVVAATSADLGIGMTGPAGGTVNAGQAPTRGLSYTIAVSNAGPNTSGTITVVDTIPTGATDAVGAGTGWSCGTQAGPGGTITCTAPSLANGQSAQPLIISMVAPPNGGMVTNSATVMQVATITDPSGNNTTSLNTTVVAQADLSITKTAPAGVVAGNDITYNFTVTNNGPSQATGVQVDDQVTSPASSPLTFVPGGGTCGTGYPCSLGTINTSPSFSGNVTNMATVTTTTTGGDPVSSNNSMSATTNIGPQADLKLAMTGPASANAGQAISYTITIDNFGPSQATNLVVTDVTPVGLAFQSASGGGCSAFPCTIATLGVGSQVVITANYAIPANYNNGAISNTASVSSDANDPGPQPNSATVTTSVGQPADVSISKSGPSSIALGQNITYTITVSNFGPATATGVTVTDAAPAGLTFVSASASQGSCSGTTTVTCSLGTLTTGPPATITLTYNVPANYAGSSITNTATVASGNDQVSGNNSSTATTTVTSQTDLSITKSGPPSAIVGSTISYTITVMNNGAVAAANTFVNDATPSGLTFVSNSGGCSGPFPCSLGTVASGASVVITSTYNVPANYAGASISNTATVSTSSAESNTSNNSATATTPVSGTGVADLAVTKSGPTAANTNNAIDFTITVYNNGPSTATNVVVSDPTPAGLAFISNSGACSTPYPCTITSIPSGTLIAITSRYRVTALSGTVTNTASATSSQSDPVPANNSSSLPVVITAGLVCPTAPVLTSPPNGAPAISPIIFSWNGSPNATSYIVSISSANGGTQTFPTAAATLTQSLPNGSYTWNVQAVGNAGCPNATSSTFSFTVCNNPGTPIPSVVGLSMTGQTYAVSWTATEGTTQYELQESLDATFSAPTSTLTASTTVSFTKNVQTATAFFYRVRALQGCSPIVGLFSATAPVVIVPISSLGSTGPNIVVPAGSTQPVTFPLQVPGLPGGSTSFVATVDKPWLAVTPTQGIMPPEGLTFTISADPSSLQNGTWTGTVIIIFGSTSVNARTHAEDTAKTSIPVSISLVTPVSPGTQSSPASSAVVIPSVGHLAGLGSQWQSDIRIANITALSKKVQLTFNQGSASSSAVKQTTLSIDAGATTALDDIVRNWFGVGALGDSSNGVLTVQPLDAGGKPDTSIVKATVASSRTFNASAVGTLGQFIPAVPIPSFISTAVGSNTILALQQIAQSDTFRTNLGIVEATGKSASALVSVFDGAGSRLLDLPLTIAAGEQRQLNSFLADKGITLNNGHIEVQATGGDGKLTAYASVIDSRTTDPLLVSGVPIGGAGATRFVIPGVASLDTGATWRSDVRIFNGGNTPQTATLTLFPTGNPSASVASSVTIQPGEVKALDDIVHLTNAGGALHVTTAVSAPLIVTARTYDQTSTGTLGQFLQAVTPADAVGVSDRSLQLLQMEDSPRYRTNLGLAEVTGKAVTAEVTVILPDSKVAPKVQIPLGAFEYRQFPIISSLGLGNTYNARISVKVIDGQGKVTAYGSVIDQKTQDPTFVPAQ
jgi:uncharacterized repeat protein (TIGR01451 family)